MPLKSGPFLLFLAVAFLNAFVDLGHKILIQNTVFKTFDGEAQIMLSALINALILLPFVLMMTPSSYLADRFNKSKVMEYGALSAIVITILITTCYYLGWFWAAFGMTLLLAVQSAIYSPAKYGYIKELTGVKSLARANGATQAVTTTAILLGTFVFSLAFEHLLAGSGYDSPQSVLPLIGPLGFVLIGLSFIEYLAAKRLTDTGNNNPGKHFDLKSYLNGKAGFAVLKEVADNQVIFKAIMGLAIFWSLCQVVLAAFPAYAKDVAGMENTALIQGIMALAGTGIIMGSIVAGKISRNYIETGLVPVGAAGVTLSMAFLALADSPSLMALTFIALGFFGGLFLVPLNALIQYQASEHNMGRILAGSNFIQNLTMLVFLVLTIAATLMGVASYGLFGTLFVVAGLGAMYTVYHLPQTLARLVVGVVFSLRYRLKVMGMDNIPAKGGVLLLGNHVSWIDWAIIQMTCPRPVRFVMDRGIYNRWYLRPIFDRFNIIPVSGGGSKGALDAVRDSLNQGDVVCLFPEGAISRNGHLGEFQRGFEVAAKGADAVIVPFYLRGLWGSRFSRSSDRLKSQRAPLFSDLIVGFGKLLPIESDRFAVKQAVHHLSITTWNEYVAALPSLGEAIVEGLSRTGSEMAAADIIGGTLSGHRMLAAVLAFSRRIKGHYGQNIGLLVPSASAGAIANAAVLVRGKTAVNLNFTANPQALVSAFEQTEMRAVLTSRKFISKLESKGFDSRALEKADLIYLEDLRDNMSKAELFLYLMVAKLMPACLIKALFCSRSDTNLPAAILFSSGSEGAPKGVMLSHQNLMTNIKQVSDVMNTELDDVVMSVLPIFHAFGLTVTTLMPMVESLPMICHPDPADVKNIAKGIATYRGTILCGTSTFLRMYARDRKVTPLMLDSLRLIVAGAERLDPCVRDTFRAKFGKTIYEGYGATETSPVASVNIEDKICLQTFREQKGNKGGTVGMPLPGTGFRIVDPDNLSDLPQGEAGLILIGGGQVMTGYFGNPEKTATVISETDGVRWYHTGDKGHLDDDGFLTIVDRYSRFAKIGGEMVRLGAIESLAQQHTEGEVMAVTIPDGKKGEKIVLLYTPEVDKPGLHKVLKESLIPIEQPGLYLSVDVIPKLGTGKKDYGKGKMMAIEGLN